MYDFQKANMWKRISAWLFDFILLITVLTMVAIPISYIFGYDEKIDAIDSIENEYREEMIADGLDPDISAADFEKLPESEKERYREVDRRRAKDERLGVGYAIISNIIVTMVFVSILAAYVILELIVPILLKNGQTVGKKIFGLAVVHSNCVKFRGQAHFIRAVIGKCVIETMVPVFLAMMVLFGNLGIVGIVVLALILILQIYAVASTKTHSAIHDLISDAVVVDFASQMIFESHEELMEYKNRLHAEAVSKTDY